MTQQAAVFVGFMNSASPFTGGRELTSLLVCFRLCFAADAGHVERVDLLEHQESPAGQRHEAGARRAAGRGLRLAARDRRARVVR